jgi:hypothetical protein
MQIHMGALTPMFNNYDVSSVDFPVCMHKLRYINNLSFFLSFFLSNLVRVKLKS